MAIQQRPSGKSSSLTESIGRIEETLQESIDGQYFLLVAKEIVWWIEIVVGRKAEDRGNLITVLLLYWNALFQDI